MRYNRKIFKPVHEFFFSGNYNYILSVIIVSGTVLICSPLASTQSYHVVSYILLFVVSLLSTFMKTGPVLLTSTLSALLWNFYFIPPHLTFHIEKTEDILIFGLFFIIALVNGVLTTRVRRQKRIAREREKRTNALFNLTRELSKAGGINEVLKVSAEELINNFKLNPLFILQDGNDVLKPDCKLQNDKKLSPIEFNVAEWVFKHLEKAGAYTVNNNFVDYTFYPLKGNRINPGVIAVRHEELFPNKDKSYFDTFVALISNALEREFLGEMAQKARFLDESDRLYKTLFNSISHELRIPVATILGASDSLVSTSNSEHIQKALSQEIFTASLRLNRLIENLLNMSRLESGYISVRLDWYDINDLINKVVEDLKEELKPFSLKLNIPEEIPFVKIDFGLMEQTLYNLIINSTQNSPAATEIILNIYYYSDTLYIELIDNGSGFPENDIKNIFKKFFRVNSSKTGGLGLGLSIAKGFVEAHKGQITVENTNNKGTKFMIKIPTERPEIKNF